MDLRNSRKLAALLAASGILFATGIEAATTNQPGGAAGTGSELFGEVVAKGKGVEVKRSRIDQELAAIRGSAAARGQAIPPEQMLGIEQQILQRIIHMQLLRSRATEADIAKAKESTEKRLESIRERAGSEEALTRQLKAVGMTLNELRDRMQEEAVAEAVLERELKIEVTDAEIKKFYEENPGKFEQPEMVKAAHILLSTRDMETKAELPEEKKAAKRKLAEELVQRARKGEDFSKLVSQYSEDPGSKERGGEYTFPRGQMVPEFEAAAFSLETNKVSDVVATQFGYHVIKKLEQLPAKKIELDKVKTEVRDFLKQQEAAKVVGPYMQKITEQANVEITDERLKPRPTAGMGGPAIDIPPPQLDKAEPKK